MAEEDEQEMRGRAALSEAALKEAFDHVEKLLERPERLLDSGSEEAQAAAEQARSLVKLFFDAAQVRCPQRLREAAAIGPGGIVVDGFDREQIWEELEVQNLPLRRHLRHRLARLSQGGVELAVPREATAQPAAASKPPRVPRGAGAGKRGTAAAEGAGEDAPKVSEKKKGKGKRKAQEGEEEPPAEGKGEDGSDRFFSLEEMNRFADLADKGKVRLSENDEDDDDSEVGALDIGDDDAEDEEAKNLMFSDFFGPPDADGDGEGAAGEPAGPRGKEKKKAKGKAKGPARKAGASESGGDDEEEEDDAEPLGGDDADDLSDEEKALEEQLRKLQKQGRGRGEEQEGEEDEEEEEGESEEARDEEGAAGSKRRSLYEMDSNLRALEEEVARLEEEQLEEKAWSLRGEVSARQRPLNSLLELHVEQPMSHFAGRRAEDAAVASGQGGLDEEALEDAPGADGAAKQPRVDIDAIIRQRVWDEAYDDVVRRAELPPSQRPIGKEDDVVETLNFEKSRIGLGDIYAKQYEADLLGHKTEGEEKEDKDKAECKALFAKLMFKLDQLTNAHFTPRPPMLGLSGEQLAKTPSLKMEETIPLMVSDAQLRAPEELKAPRRHEREQAELTHDERAATRRAKKVRRKKALDRRLSAGELTLGGLRERNEALLAKNADAKRERAAKGTVKEQRKRLRASDLLAQAAQNAATGATRKEEARRERQQRPADAPGSKRLKL